MKFESLIEQKSEETLREMLARYDRGERCFVGLDLAGVEMRGTDPRHRVFGWEPICGGQIFRVRG